MEMELEVKDFVEVLVDFLTETVEIEELPRVDAIFVFGHYDPRVAQYAAELWRKGKATDIIVSGRGGTVSLEGFLAEADFYASILEREGVPKGRIILERESMNSLENIQMGMTASLKRGFDPKSLILCAIPPLLRRSCATFRKQFPGITVYGAAFPMEAVEWATIPRIKRLVGELDRLRRYCEKGDVVPVEIPDAVVLAERAARQFLLR